MKNSRFLKKLISFVMVISLVVCSGVLNVTRAETLADYSKLDKAIATIPDGPNRTNGVYKTEELEAIDAMVASFDRNLTSENQSIVDGYRTELSAAIKELSMDLSKAEATVTVVIDRKIVKQDDIITVFVKINTNYPVTGFQLPVLYDKTQFTLVDYDTDNSNSYITFCDGSFKNGSYDLNGNAGLTAGFSYTSDPEKWDTDEAREKYDYAFFTAAFNSQKNPSNLNLAVPENEEFATFRLQAKNDIENAEELVFISPDWIKSDVNKAGVFSVGFSGTVLNKNPLSYIATGMTYNLKTDSMIPTDSISLNITEAVLTKSEPTVQLVATVTPETAVNRRITWTSSDTSVATVDETGKVTRVGTGEAVITAETPYGQVATCKITVLHQCFAELTLVKEKEAECYIQGNLKHYKCTCGKLYSDSEALKEVNEEDIIIPELNHPDDGNLKVNGVKPTHTKNGRAEYWICGYCGDFFSEEACINKIDEPAVIPALGHDDLTNAEWSYDADSHYKQCSCREKFETTPHTLQWVTEKEPTCADEGSKHQKCTVCGFVTNENTPIDCVPHNPVMVNAVESTCVKAGNIEYYRCGDCTGIFRDEACTEEITLKDTYLPFAEHDYEENVTLPTPVRQGFTTYTCKACGYSYIDNFTGPGIEITGIISTSAFDTDEVTLILTSKGETEPLQTLKLTGNSTTYSFENVTHGEYTVTVSKNNHYAQSFDFSVVDEEKITRDLIIYAYGDINQDGKLNVIDYSAVLRHVKGIERLDEEMAFYADVNSSGHVSVSDYALILRQVKGVNSIWK